MGYVVASQAGTPCQYLVFRTAILIAFSTFPAFCLPLIRLYCIITIVITLLNLISTNIRFGDGVV